MSGAFAPAATGMSVRPAISTIRSAFGSVSSSGTFPATGVMASIFNSGERMASSSANASSRIGVDDHSEGTTGWLFGGTYSGMCLVGESACCQSGGRDGHKLAACNGKGFTIRIHIVALVQRLMTYKCGKEYFALSTH